jgi:hypothetical protein
LILDATCLKSGQELRVITSTRHHLVPDATRLKASKDLPVITSTYENNHGTVSGRADEQKDLVKFRSETTLSLGKVRAPFAFSPGASVARDYNQRLIALGLNILQSSIGPSCQDPSPHGDEDLVECCDEESAQLSDVQQTRVELNRADKQCANLGTWLLALAGGAMLLLGFSVLYSRMVRTHADQEAAESGLD